MITKTLTELSKALREKKISSVELTKAYLQQIKLHDSTLNSFITVTEDIALAQAKKADEKLAKGEAHPLTGIPLAHKDLFCTQGIKTTCGSKILGNFISPYDATLIAKLQSHGTVMLGKTNMDEFAMGASNETSYFGPVKNPWDTSTVPGGSSGGSAAAVAANFCAAATGTDTGGSIRQPASMCGITGIKPTYGRVSRFGMVAFASSLDQAGPMTKSAEDAAVLLQAMAGFDEKDSTSVDKPVPNYLESINHPLTDLTIGLPKEYFNEQLDSNISHILEAAIAELKKLGVKTKEISLPNTHLSIPAYYIIAPAECSSNLSRFDGVRYGHRCQEPKNLHDLYSRTRGEGFGAEVKRRIIVGTYALSAGYFDAFYVKAQKIRRLISNDYQQALKEVDLIISPTCPETAFALGSKNNDPIKMYQSDIFTNAVNLAGLPGISFPAGFMNKMPIGMQLVGNYFDEARLLNVAHLFQQATDWHLQRAPL